MTEESRRKEANSSYGITYTPKYTNCPNIYEQEPGKTGGGSLDRSSQNSWYNGTTKFTSGKYTFYGYSISSKATQTMYDTLLTNMSANSTSGTDNHISYWVASRCIYFDGSIIVFDIFILHNGGVNANSLYNSSGLTSTRTYAVRPVIEINLDLVSIGDTGSGTNTTPYSIALK